MHYLRPSNQNKFPIYIISESFLVQKKLCTKEALKISTKPNLTVPMTSGDSPASDLFTQWWLVFTEKIYPLRNSYNLTTITIYIFAVFFICPFHFIFHFLLLFVRCFYTNKTHLNDAFLHLSMFVTPRRCQVDFRGPSFWKKNHIMNKGAIWKRCKLLQVFENVLKPNLWKKNSHFEKGKIAILKWCKFTNVSTSFCNCISVFVICMDLYVHVCINVNVTCQCTPATVPLPTPKLLKCQQQRTKMCAQCTSIM